MNPQLAELLKEPRPVRLNRVALPRGLRLVVLAPHPDDFDAIGVTMELFHDSGARMSVAVLSSGASGVEDADAVPPTPARKAEIRMEEQRRSCRLFGLAEDDVEFLRLEETETDGEPADSEANARAIARLLDRCRPDLVFLPHGHDEKPGHRNVFSLFRQAAEASGAQIVAFLNRDPKTVAMRTDAYTAFGEGEALWKAELLRCHDSQQQRNLRTRGRGFDERILDVNRRIARDLGAIASYAESFEIACFGGACP